MRRSFFCHPPAYGGTRLSTGSRLRANAESRDGSVASAFLFCHPPACPGDPVLFFTLPPFHLYTFIYPALSEPVPDLNRGLCARRIKMNKIICTLLAISLITSPCFSMPVPSRPAEQQKVPIHGGGGPWGTWGKILLWSWLAALAASAMWHETDKKIYEHAMWTAAGICVMTLMFGPFVIGTIYSFSGDHVHPQKHYYDYGNPYENFD